MPAARLLAPWPARPRSRTTTRPAPSSAGERGRPAADRPGADDDEVGPLVVMTSHLESRAQPSAPRPRRRSPRPRARPGGRTSGAGDRPGGDLQARARAPLEARAVDAPALGGDPGAAELAWPARSSRVRSWALSQQRPARDEIAHPADASPGRTTRRPRSARSGPRPRGEDLDAAAGRRPPSARRRGTPGAAARPGRREPGDAERRRARPRSGRRPPRGGPGRVRASRRGGGPARRRADARTSNSSPSQAGLAIAARSAATLFSARLR